MMHNTYFKLALAGLLVLAVGYTVSDIVSPAMAGKPPCDPDVKNCGGGGGGGGGTKDRNLVAKFCLEMFLDDLNPGLAPDDVNQYCDDKEQKVLVFTGKGPGFRFDSNTSKRFSPPRTVMVNVDSSTPNLPPGFVTGDYLIDFRFNKDGAELGLDLGKVTDAGDSTVPINIWLKSTNGQEHFGLAYSTNPGFPTLNDGRLDDNDCINGNADGTFGGDTSDAKVTLLDDGSGDTTRRWSIESASDNACLWDLNALDSKLPGTLVGIEVNMPFYFEIEIK